MVQAPGVQIRVESAAALSAEGPLAERALEYARQFLRTIAPERGDEPPRPHRIVVEHAAPEHMGLGTGTQLGLAVARALALAHGLGEVDAVELARRVGRGQRSALGIHGFAQGGFLVEGGKRQPDDLAPLVARVPFPEAWRIVLVLPQGGVGLHGLGESHAFADLAGQQTLVETDTLCRLALLGMLPALAEQDLAAFGEALYDFNCRVGEAFRLVQGGTYAHPRTAEVVAFVRRQGVRGVGQSSWGPAVYAVMGTQVAALDLEKRLRRQFSLTIDEIAVAAANNQGATVL
jgi:beta-ribofuranosylaminobenzene 5'-phosphate synthase